MRSVPWDEGTSSNIKFKISILEPKSGIEKDITHMCVLETRGKTNRMWAGFQNIPKVKRPYIRVNGVSMKELDRKCSHVSIAYGKEDDYYSKVPAPRKDVKKAMTIMLNTKSRGSAVQVLCDGRKSGSFTKEYAHTLLDAVECVHEPIKEHFYNKEKGLEKMRTESEMARRIVKCYTDREECCLPIHDGFLVREGLADDLKEVMERIFNEVLEEMK